MKRLFLLIAAIWIPVIGYSEYVPTPDLAMSFKMGDDHRNWTMVSQNGNRNAIIAEFTVDKEDINNWSEMVAQQIDFGTLSLDQHFRNWVAMLKRADPKIVITEDHAADGSILATYDSKAFDEVSVRRFVKGTDGIYMLAYHVRHRVKNADTWNLWIKIVSKASLVPNPLRRK